MCFAARSVISPVLTPVRHSPVRVRPLRHQMAPKRGSNKRPKRPAASSEASLSDSDEVGRPARAPAAAAASAAHAVVPISRRNSTRLAAAARGEQAGDRDMALAMARDGNSALTDSDDPPEAVEVAAQRDAEHSDDSDADRREPANSTAAQRRAAQCAAVWTEQPQQFERAEFQAHPLPSDAARKPVEWFRIFLDAAAMRTMVEATNRRLTALREERVTAGAAAAAEDRRVRNDLINELRNTSEPELLSYIGILLVMGVVHMENVENYWDLEWGYKPVFEGWPRRRWQALMAALSVGHVSDGGGDDDEPACAAVADDFAEPEVDSSADHVDDAPVSASAAAASAAAANPYEHSPRDPERRFAGLRGFVDRMNSNFARAIGDPGPELCIDERMIRARHKHPAIQLMPKKPIKLGFKSFVLACGDGYVLSSVLYPGKSGASPEAGLTANVVLRLMWPYRGRWRRVVTDQWYTGVELALALYQLQITTVGTIRADRKLVPSQLRTGAAGEIKVLQHRTSPALHLIGFYKTAKKGDRRLYLSTSTAAPGVWRERVRPTAADYKQRSAAAASAAALAAAAAVPLGADIAVAAAPVAAALAPALAPAPVFGAASAAHPAGAGPAAAAAAAATSAEQTLTAAVDRVADRTAMGAFYRDAPDPQLVLATAAAVATAKSALVDAKRSADVAAVTRTPMDAAMAAADAVRRDAAIARVTVAGAADAQHRIPAVAAEYNRRMGVVDAANRMAAMNTPWRKSRDWRHCIIVDYIYTAVSNAYLLMRARQPQDDAVRCGYGAFVVSLARELINGYTPRQRQRRKRRVTHDRSASLAAATGCVVCYRQQKVLHAHHTSADRVGHRTTKCCSGCGIALCKTLSCLVAANKQRPCASATDTDPTDSDAF
jgi:hypothetical protein